MKAVQCTAVQGVLTSQEPCCARRAHVTGAELLVLGGQSCCHAGAGSERGGAEGWGRDERRSFWLQKEPCCAAHALWCTQIQVVYTKTSVSARARAFSLCEGKRHEHEALATVHPRAHLMMRRVRV